MAEQVRLCPHCANSISIDAAKCPYCKAVVDSSATPQWPTRETAALSARLPSSESGLSAASKIVLLAGIAALALGLYLMVTQRGRSETQLLLEAKVKELQEKEQKIQGLEAETAKTRQTLNDQTGQLSETKTKLEESQKELAAARVRLGLATREADRLASNRAPAGAPASARTPDPASQPAQSSSRRGAEAGVYETLRATTVYEDASGSSRVLSQIGAGTRINVVRSVGDWLEVRSKQGNPPGFVRQDDAKFVARAN